MGLYIEAGDKVDKINFAEKYGEEISYSDIKEFEDIPNDKVLTVLINNGLFVAHGVLYDKREFDYIVKDLHKRDARPKRYFIMYKKDIKPYCPEYDLYFDLTDLSE
jgi:hypothetical protein